MHRLLFTFVRPTCIPTSSLSKATACRQDACNPGAGLTPLAPRVVGGAHTEPKSGLCSPVNGRSQTNNGPVTPPARRTRPTRFGGSGNIARLPTRCQSTSLKSNLRWRSSPPSPLRAEDPYVVEVLPSGAKTQSEKNGNGATPRPFPCI